MTTAITRFRDDRRWLPFVNNSSGSVPAYAIVRLEGAALETDGLVYYKVSRPRGRGIYAANSSKPVSAGGFGVATVDWPAMVSLSVGSPIPGENWGIPDNSWNLAKTDGGGALFGFFCLGLTVNRDGVRRTLVLPDQPTHFQVTPDDDIEPGKDGDCTIKEASSSGDLKITVSNDWMEQDVKVSEGKEAIASWFPEADSNKGRWQFTAAECE